MPNLDLKGDQKPAQILKNWGTQKMISQPVLENCKKKNTKQYGKPTNEQKTVSFKLISLQCWT